MSLSSNLPKTPADLNLETGLQVNEKRLPQAEKT